MEQKDINPVELQEQYSDIILVLDKEKKKIEAVKSIDEKGELETVSPTKKNGSQFMQVDRHGDFFSNFFKNFIQQLKNPTRYTFFHVPADLAIEKAKEIQKHINTPTTEGAKVLQQHEIKTDAEQGKQKEVESPITEPQQNDYRYRPEQIDWETMNNLGLGKERLEKLNLLEPLLKGYKTNSLTSISLNLGGVVTRMDARLSLQPGPNDTAIVAIHGIRKEPNLHSEFFGHKFTDEEKKNLLESGNLGKIINLKNTKTGETIPSIVSVDRLTNELVALRAEYIKIPDEIKGLKLNEEQKQTLLEGKALYLEGMISKKGDPFNANIQFNADKRQVEFLFNRGKLQNQSNNQEHQPTIETFKIFRGKELSNEQFDKFKDGQTIYIDNLIDKNGKPYQGYITYNKEKNRADFSFKNPTKIQEQSKPTEDHKTQVAVNSDGKTNNATNKINEPLQSKQQSAKDEKQQKLQEEVETPVKSHRRRI